MRNIKLTLSYDGSQCCGWQSQKQGELTVQGVMEDAIERLTGMRASLSGSGRTDSGVHALAQVAAFETASEHSPEIFVRALNSMLPPDIRVLSAEEAPEGFHPQKSARGKRYAYLISNTRVVSPFVRRYTCHAPQSLDLRAMDEAAMRLVGEHDFSCFMASGSSVKTTQRNLRELSIISSNSVEFLGLGLHAHDGQFIRIEAEGSGFLRHMVRNIAGTLLEVGKGAMEVSFMDELLASRNRKLAGPTAPAEGLFLVSVAY